MILRAFDPWKNPLCTCPSKLSLNPYTGCSHGCLYCYASSYIPRFNECRPKKDLLSSLRRELARAQPGVLISMSNSSDPYPPMEGELMLTRRCLQLLKPRDIRVQVVTKSDLVCRDADLLKSMRSAVSITITTLDASLAARLEPSAPMPEKRLNSIEKLRTAGIPVSARIDPIIPEINDSEIEDLVYAVSQADAQHITSSTYKARSDNWRRICDEFQEEADKLARLFKSGLMIGGSRYLPEGVRAELMSRVKKASLEVDMTFSTCREGSLTTGSASPILGKDPSTSCDGSHLAYY